MKKVYETIYPNDAAGYKCYSILIWELSLERTHDWGTFNVDVMECRFIWGGVLVHHILEINRYGQDKLIERAKVLDENWKFCIDLLFDNEKSK